MRRVVLSSAFIFYIWGCRTLMQAVSMDSFEQDGGSACAGMSGKGILRETTGFGAIREQESNGVGVCPNWEDVFYLLRPRP